MTVKINGRYSQSMVWMAAIALISVFIGGCQFRDNAPEFPAVLLPVSMDIHPFTSQYSSGSDGGIDVRLEFKDYFGDSVKGYGSFVFEVYGFRSARVVSRGKRMAYWTVDLSDPAINHSHWDGLSRTYRFKLNWTPPKPEDAPVHLEVVFNPAMDLGERLFSEKDLPVAEKAEKK